ncbi:hypothetical protein AKJ16_DCAP00410 [Drosera capensis]
MPPRPNSESSPASTPRNDHSHPKPISSGSTTRSLTRLSSKWTTTIRDQASRLRRDESSVAAKNNQKDGEGRLLDVDFEDADSSSEVIAKGWMINTKYYTADVSVWIAHLHDGFSLSSLPNSKNLAALVMIFDMNDLASLVALKEWVARSDIQKFDILLCIGNKVDLVHGHPVHVEYRKRLQRLENPLAYTDDDFTEYGICETEGTSLLDNGELSVEIKKSCLEWCADRNIEYLEACASNIEFDKCLSVDGDSQGVERLFGALSAYMWPGMALKSGDKIHTPLLPDRPELSEEEESDYEIEYEILSGGSAEPWDDAEERWVSANEPASSITSAESQTVDGTGTIQQNGASHEELSLPSASSTSWPGESSADHREVIDVTDGPIDFHDPDNGGHLELDELEQLMSEIGNTRNSLRLIPDFQRREMAAKLAMRMAAMFGESSEGEEEFD